MDVFGHAWERHTERLSVAWKQTVEPKDTVLVAGDISWAMREKEIFPDIAFLAGLPGRKVLLKGNHDYWWSTRTRVQKLFPDDFVLQTNAVELPDCTIVGSRGWELPPEDRLTDDDRRLFKREVERLRLSLEAGSRTGKPLIAMMHYPPLPQDGSQTPFSALLEQHGVRQCVYGHLHGGAHRNRVEGAVRSVEYHLVAGDYLGFKPKFILPNE